MKPKKVFISADHGLSIVYFLQSDVVSTLLDNGVEVILLTDDNLKEHIEASFGRPGLFVEGLRMQQARAYFQQEQGSVQWWLDFLRRAGASNRINLQAVDSYIHQVEGEAHSRRKRLFPIMNALVGIMRRSRLARKIITQWQNRFNPCLYADLFEKYRPDLVIASTPGWRSDRYILREAASGGVMTAAAIVGWDNTSSYSLPGAPVDWITCWAQIQKDELIKGSDWSPSKVNVAGIPSYDGYFRQQWLLPKEEYFQLHGLDPKKLLISYACSFISFSPNIQNVEALAELVSGSQLKEPAQLLVRYHPNHFLNVPRFIEEREQIHVLSEKNKYVHVVEPVPLGGELGYYSGEDMPEKSSMMAYSDIFTTVYSTMVVEASIHNRPVISICIDSPVGWPGKFTLPLSQIGGWPTHSRFRNAGAGRETLNINELRDSINYYITHPNGDHQKRLEFIDRECTYTDGDAGKRTAEFFLTLLDKTDDEEY